MGPERQFHSNINTLDHEYLDRDHDAGAALRKIRTAGSISISPELFEKLYLSPETQVKGDLRKTFGNPTPLGLAAFCMSLTPLTFDLLGFRFSGGDAAAGDGPANIGIYYGFGAFLSCLSGLLEFFLGNTFSAVVFLTYGAFWFSLASTLVPGFGAYAHYSPDPTGDPIAGLSAQGYENAVGLWVICMMVMSFIYMVASVRTNIFLFTIFLTLTLTYGIVAGELWERSGGNAAHAAVLQTAAGCFAFISCMCGWYLFVVQMLASVDFPLNLPVGDLSGLIRGASEKTRSRV